MKDTKNAESASCNVVSSLSYFGKQYRRQTILSSVLLFTIFLVFQVTES